MPFGQSDIGRGFWSWASAISTAAKQARFSLKCRSGESENRPILIDKESFADVSISKPATPARSSFQDDSYFITFRNCEIPFRNWPILFWYLCWTMTKSHLLQLVSIPTVVTALATFLWNAEELRSWGESATSSFSGQSWNFKINKALGFSNEFIVL